MAERAAYQKAVDQFSDWRWRLNNLYYVLDKNGRRVRFEMWSEQADFYDQMHYLNVVLKARQRGITTFMQIFMLDACVFNSDIRAGTIAHNLGDALAIFQDKVKYPYDQLPDGIKDAVPLVKDSASTLMLANNSSLRVATSMRSGTLQYLHVSEYGKICAKYPDKAKEIRTGALNAVQAGQIICIESTAEGQEGHFFDLCQSAIAKQEAGKTLTALDYKLHFYPWFNAPEYWIDPTDVVVTAEQTKYFDSLEAELDITISNGQRAWYVKKEEDQQEDMRREYPSTPKEAFEASVEGAYFSRQLTIVRKRQQVCKIPIEPGLPVNTFWDLGLNDQMTIWLHQQHQKEHRFVGYHENNGEGFAYYKRWLSDWANDNDVTFGKHFAPHDIEVRNLGVMAETRKEAAAKVGINFETVPRVQDKMDAIQATREVLPSCWFDEENAAEGLKHLTMYRKDWDDKKGVFKSYPRHDAASHGADGFMTFSLAEQQGMIGASRPRSKRKARQGTVA